MTLLRFTIENMFSFKGQETLDLSSVKFCKERLDEATFPICAGVSLRRALKVVGIYGANASGKSNLLRAIHIFISFALNSAGSGFVTARVPVSPFLHVEKWEGEPPPTKMEAVFVLGDIQYRYGFAATGVRVLEEWLYRKEIARKYARETELFVRYQENGEDRIDVSPIFEKADRLIVEKTRRNALFLSTASLLAVPEAMTILQEGFARLKVFSADDDSSTMQTAQMILENRYRDQILSFLTHTDDTIDSIEIVRKDVSENFTEMLGTSGNHTFALEPRVYLKNPNGGSYGQSIALESIVSRGTSKAFRLAGPMFEALGTGGVMMMDELDSRMHPILVRQIIRLFNSAASNPKNAQLVFNTHDTNLLNGKVYDPSTKSEDNLLRRDQVYFVERDGEYASHLYSLIEFQKDGKQIRSDASFEKDYLNGLYGSIPYIGNFWEI